MRESSIQDKIAKYLRRQQDVYPIKTHGACLMGQRGLPDFVGCCQGKFFGVEVKQPGEKATPIQLFQRRQIHKAGGLSIVATSLEEVERFIALLRKS
jgi:hypothetical protein